MPMNVTRKHGGESRGNRALRDDIRRAPEGEVDGTDCRALDGLVDAQQMDVG